MKNYAKGNIKQQIRYYLLNLAKQIPNPNNKFVKIFISLFRHTIVKYLFKNER